MTQATLRNGLLLAFCYLLFAEFLSWITASWPGPCLIQWEHPECPTFIAGIVLMTERASDFIKHDDHDKVIVAAFTAVLALSTIGLWLATVSLQRSTNNLWKAAERQIAVAQQASEHVRISERAHINGGFGGKIIGSLEAYRPHPQACHILINLNNYGKTQGFVRRIAVAIRPLSTLPQVPDYPVGIEPGLLLPPGIIGFGVQSANAWWDGSEGQVFYGRIWFTDVFDPTAIRFSSFILNVSDMTAVMDRPAYWEAI